MHIGCGMDSRAERVGTRGHLWFDVDFPDVIIQRKRYYQESAEYRMIASDIRDPNWLNQVPKGGEAIIVMEGVSMYLHLDELKDTLKTLSAHFCQTYILMDCYTKFAAKATKYKNPINDVGVTCVYGMDNPKSLEAGTGLSFLKEHEMTPDVLVNELRGVQRVVFRRIFAGSLSKKMYRLYEYRQSRCRIVTKP